MENQIINNWLKTYLIGPMEEVVQKDGGRGWRTRVTERLSKFVDSNNNPIYVFDPTLEEQNKIGMESETFHKKVSGWLASGHDDKVAEGGRLIWKGKTYIEKTDQGRAKLVHIMGDIDYVVNSDFIICYMEKDDKPCGTFMEVGIAFEHNIPVYVIQTMPKKDYRGSFSQAVLGVGGAYFSSESELFEFLRKKYKLKKKRS